MKPIEGIVSPMGKRSWLWGLILASTLSCADKEDTPQHLSTWSVVGAAFDTDFFDKDARMRWFTGAAAKDMVLPSMVTPDRYQYLGLAELRWTGPDRRQGEVAFSIDGWPATMMIQMTRVKDQWQFVQVSPAAQQERLVELLGPAGFPIIRGAEKWDGGFAGRDAAGRPTASIMIVGHQAGTFVDGQGPFPHEAAPVKAALRRAMKTRAALAERAHAVYRPQAALALGRRQPAHLLVDLSRWASEAGAEGLQLVARTASGKPAWVPLARLASAPPGARPKLLRVDVTGKATQIDCGDYSGSIPQKGNPPDPETLAFGMASTTAQFKDASGGLLVVRRDLQIDAIAKLLVAVQDAMPDTPFAVELAK